MWDGGILCVRVCTRVSVGYDEDPPPPPPPLPPARPLLPPPRAGCWRRKQLLPLSLWSSDTTPPPPSFSSGQIGLILRGPGLPANLAIHLSDAATDAPATVAPQKECQEGWSGPHNTLSAYTRLIDCTVPSSAFLYLVRMRTVKFLLVIHMCSKLYYTLPVVLFFALCCMKSRSDYWEMGAIDLHNLCIYLQNSTPREEICKCK